MRYRKEKLCNHIDILSGYAFKSKDFTNIGVPVIKIKNITPPMVTLDDLSYVSKEIAQLHNRFLLNYDDVLIALTGSHINQMSSVVGRIARVKYRYPSLLNQRVGKITVINYDDTDLNFVYYYLSQDAVKIQLASKAGGAANQANISPSDVKNIEIPFPDINTQHRIADILSSYDDLIENNRKQIKLLEEAAQRLYKEWFVDLRFPGHEETPIVDGVPEGWERTSFSKKVEIMSGGTPKTSNPEYYKGEIPFYSPKDSDGSFFAFDTETHISELGLYNCNSKLYPPGTVIVTARGTVGKTTILSVPMAMNQSCYALKSEMLSSVYYLFFALRKEIATLKAMANGGVFDTIIVKTFDSISLLDPGKRLINQFDHEVTPIMDSIKIKMQNNSLLAESRDRLLPKLMSGEIEV